MKALQQEYNKALSGMQGRDILVIGDMVADIYLDGRISRISREAPVLVLEQAGEKVVAGGAANVVNNIATLGGKVHAVGLVGRDKSADGLREILAANGADVRGLIADDSRPTISKTRIIAGGRATVSQQIVRIDRESKAPMAPAVGAELRASYTIRPNLILSGSVQQRQIAARGAFSLAVDAGRGCPRFRRAPPRWSEPGHR